MVNRNDANGDALLQQVIEHLRRQEIPDFPDPEIAVSESTKKYASSVHSISPLWRMIMNRRFQLSAGAIVGLAALLGFLLLWGGRRSRYRRWRKWRRASVRRNRSRRHSHVGFLAFSGARKQLETAGDKRCSELTIGSRLGSTAYGLNGHGTPTAAEKGHLRGGSTSPSTTSQREEPLAICYRPQGEDVDKVGTPKGFHGAEMVGKAEQSSPARRTATWAHENRRQEGSLGFEIEHQEDRPTARQSRFYGARLPNK